MSASDINRLFLQAIISRHYMSDELAKVLCKKAIEAVKSVNDSIGVVYNSAFFDALVVQVNESLEPLGLEFRTIMNEEDGKRVWALVNNKGDEISQMATQYSSQEIAFFKQLVDQIMLAPNESFSITSLAALREVNHLPVKSNMTKSQAEVVLGSFVARGWLLKSASGRYSLSARTIMELQPYLKSTYEEETLECTSCMEIITKGVACYRPNCKARFHFHCYTRYRTPKCPTCSAEWTRDRLNKVGEDAAVDDRPPRGKQNAHQSSEGEEESEGEDALPAPVKKGGRSKRKAQSSQDTDEEDEPKDIDPMPSRQRR